MSEIRKVSSSIAKALLDKGYIVIEKRIKDSNTHVSSILDVQHELTFEQEHACNNYKVQIKRFPYFME